MKGEDWVRERADTGFAWSVRLVGKTAGRGRSPTSWDLRPCVRVCVHARERTFRVHVRVCARAPTRPRDINWNMTHLTPAGILLSYPLSASLFFVQRGL